MEVHQVIKKNYPDYQWEEPAPPHMAAPSATKDPDQLSKNDWKDSDMKIYVALAWYWAQSRRRGRGENRAEEATTTWAEIAIDFEAADSIDPDWMFAYGSINGRGINMRMLRPTVAAAQKAYTWGAGPPLPE